jgi:hypothetical protein
MIDVPIVLSYQRSGLNWLRHCVERVSGRRTPGNYPHIYERGKAVFHRAHSANNVDEDPFSEEMPFFDRKGGRPRYSKMLLLVRNYKELYVRQAKKNLTLMADYVNNLLVYDAFEGEKMISYYEDVVLDFWNAMPRALEFLNVTNGLEGFDYEKERAESLTWYHKKYRTNPDAFVVNDVLRHSRKLDAETRRTLDAHFRRELPGAFDKYLTRYEEGNDGQDDSAEG